MSISPEYTSQHPKICGDGALETGLCHNGEKLRYWTVQADSGIR